VWKLFGAIFISGLDGSYPHQITSTPTHRPQTRRLGPESRRSRLMGRGWLSSAPALRRNGMLCSPSPSTRQRMFISSRHGT